MLFKLYMKYYSYLMQKVNMKSKFALFSFLRHISGLIIHSYYVCYFKKRYVTLCL